MGNIQYSVTDICYTFYRSSSPFDSTPANYTENEKDMSFIAFIKQEITSHEMKESTRKNHESTINLLRRFKPSISFNDIIISLSVTSRRTWSLLPTTRIPLPST